MEYVYILWKWKGKLGERGEFLNNFFPFCWEEKYMYMSAWFWVESTEKVTDLYSD